eukprot:scaffold7351_cov259-Pinguiococcus_pyrenoidosus.AAC.2
MFVDCLTWAVRRKSRASGTFANLNFLMPGSSWGRSQRMTCMPFRLNCVNFPICFGGRKGAIRGAGEDCCASPCPSRQATDPPPIQGIWAHLCSEILANGNEVLREYGKLVFRKDVVKLGMRHCLQRELVTLEQHVHRAQANDHDGRVFVALPIQVLSQKPAVVITERIQPVSSDAACNMSIFSAPRFFFGARACMYTVSPLSMDDNRDNNFCLGEDVTCTTQGRDSPELTDALLLGHACLKPPDQASVTPHLHPVPQPCGARVLSARLLTAWKGHCQLTFRVAITNH